MTDNQNEQKGGLLRSVTPHLICAEANAAIAFYKQAFGAVELTRLSGPDGKIAHANLRIGDSNIMLTDENLAWGLSGPTVLKGSPVRIHLQVDDVDALAQQASAAGATITMPVADMFWGDRYGQLTDPFGHLWSIATHVRDVTPEEMQQAMAAMSPECGPGQ